MIDDRDGSLDAAAARRARNRAALTYDRAAALQAEVRARLLERLDYASLSVATAVDLGTATGDACAALAKRYPGARIVAVDDAEFMLRHLREGRAGEVTALCADATALPLSGASADLVLCCLVLHRHNDPLAVLSECRRVLKPGGLLNLAAFGPDTLGEMRAAWASVDAAPHVHGFMDMHDLGDAMLHAGLAEPVLDVEHFTLTYRSLRGMARELKHMGEQNVASRRRRGLQGRKRLQALEAGYAPFRRRGLYPASFEVTFAQAWGREAVSGPDPDGGVTEIPVSLIGRRDRSSQG